MELGERIKQVRKSFKMTQPAFAEFIGVATVTVATWEHCKRIPNGTAIKSIAKMTGVNEHWLETGEGDMFDENDKEASVNRIASQLMNEDELSIRRALIDTCMELDEEELVMIKKLILQFVDKLK